MVFQPNEIHSITFKTASQATKTLYLPDQALVDFNIGESHLQILRNP